MEKLISLKSVIIDFILFLSRFQDQFWNGKCVIIICFIISSSACCIERKFTIVLFYLSISHHHRNLTQLITSKDAGHMSNFHVLKIVIFSAQKATVALHALAYVFIMLCILSKYLSFFQQKRFLMSIILSGRISDSICVLKYLWKFFIRSNKSILNNISHSNFEFISMDIHSQALQAFINKNSVLEFMCENIQKLMTYKYVYIITDALNNF